MKIGIIGCGFVADYYLSTLRLHPELQVVGLVDRQADRALLLSQRHGAPACPDVETLLANPDVELILNLTNPRDH